MQRQWALLFDLDQTLILTEALQLMRDQRKWQQISSQFHRTQLPTDTLAFLQQIRSHFCMGVVTSSPRQYAEQLITYHNLMVPVLAAYHDTPGRHKPDPAPLLFAAKRLNISPSKCFHVGDHTKDIIAAHQAGMIPIALSWDGLIDMHSISGYPHIYCTSWQEVLVYVLRKARFDGI